ncbi:MAG: von Willebrand factor type A domain-containing protein [Verrucomicrobia bacterium]|nr:von Willebrand factor type A domain-containing protein [Verrucomicrobiota bacterium]
MNSDSPQIPREEMEARLTAFLLGELSAEEAAEVRQALVQDVELAQLHDRLKRAIDLVREVATNPAAQAATPPTPLKLSEERRQKLLQQFKTVAPKEFTAPQDRDLSWILPMSAAAALVALIASVGLMLPSLARGKAKAQRIRTDVAAGARRPEGEVAQQWMDSEMAAVSPDKNGRASAERAAREDLPQIASETRELRLQLESVRRAEPALVLSENLSVGGIASLGGGRAEPSQNRTVSATALNRNSIVLPSTDETVDSTQTITINGAIAESKPEARPDSGRGRGGVAGSGGGIGFGGGGLGGGGLGGGYAYPRADAKGPVAARGEGLAGTPRSSETQDRLDLGQPEAKTQQMAAPEGNAFKGRYAYIAPAQSLDAAKLHADSAEKFSRAPSPLAPSAGLKPAPDLGQIAKPITELAGEVNPVTGSPVPQTALPNNAPVLQLTDNLRPDISNVTRTYDSDLAVALGTTPALGNAFQAADNKDKLAAGATVNSTSAPPQATTPPTAADHFAWAADPMVRSAGGDGKLGFQGGSAPSFAFGGSGGAERSPFGLKPAQPPSLQQNLTEQRAGGTVAFSVKDIALDEKVAVAQDFSGPAQAADKNVQLHFENRSQPLEQNLNRQLGAFGPNAAGRVDNGFLAAPNPPPGAMMPQAQAAAGNTLGTPLTAQLPPPPSPPEKEERAGERRSNIAPVSAPPPAAQPEEAKTRSYTASPDATPAPTGPAPAQKSQFSKPLAQKEPASNESQLYRMDPKLMERYGLIRPGMLPAEQMAEKPGKLDIAGAPSAGQDSARKAPGTVPSISSISNQSKETGQAEPLTIQSAQVHQDGSDARSKKKAGAEGIVQVGDADLRTSPTVPPVKALADADADAKAGDEVLRKKRDVEDLVESRERVLTRTLSENVDAALAKSNVKIVAPAQAESEKSPTLWERFRGTATRTARIEVAKDNADQPPLLMGVPTQNTFDPYFIQTEHEKIKSKTVLNKVIEKLNLNEAWAKKLGGAEKLKASEIYPHLLKNIDVRQDRNSRQIDIQVKSDNPAEAALIANTIAEVYRDVRDEKSHQAALGSQEILGKQLAEQEKRVAQATEELARLQKESKPAQTDPAPAKPAAPALVPQPEVQTSDNTLSTFSLNVSDVSFKLAAASLEKGVMPEPATVRSEEFINAFDYRDSEPPPGAPIAFAWERARYPFAHNRDLLRFSVKTAAQGRQAGRPLNLVLLLDNSGSMERADRVRIIREALRVLAAQLQPQDKLSVISFARTARLWADGVPGNQAAQVAERAGNLPPEGGTNLEDAMNLGYETARRHYAAGGVNRVVLLTDGAANLGNVDPEALKQKVEAQRKQGVALDCFGIGWEGFNDDLLEVLSRNGDGRYGFINSPEEAATQFAGQLAGALRVAASDVKVQVEFNPKRVTAYRQIGYAKHQLTKEQFRDNTVDAAEIGAAESGNALYAVEVNPRGEGVLAVVRVRYKEPATGFYREQEWPVPYNGNAAALEQASPAMRLAATSSAFSEWLASSPYAAEVTPDRLLAYLSGVPEVYGIDARPKKLEWMIRQAKSVAGR